MVNVFVTIFNIQLHQFTNHQIFVGHPWPISGRNLIGLLVPGFPELGEEKQIKKGVQVHLESGSPTILL